MGENNKTALILTGGGARAAYQAGVLEAVASILLDAGWAPQHNPFQIICGTSAGALNAAALACRCDDFQYSAQTLQQVWHNIETTDVYRFNSFSLLGSAAEWLARYPFGRPLRQSGPTVSRALLDNTPLVTLLHRLLDLPRLDAAFSDGSLHALAITASSYTYGHHITFYQTAAGVAPWRRAQRLALPDQIGVQHLLASSAIPLIFPPVPLYCEGRIEYCGDGSLRQIAPIAPAIHLGADKVFVIGAGRLLEPLPDAKEEVKSPSLAQIAGHAFSSIFLDGLAADIERLERTNRTVMALTPAQRAHAGLRPIEMLVIAPSQRLDGIACRHVGSLPPAVRSLLKTVGANELGGAALASYLLFEAGYTRELILLGRQDTFARRNDVLAFFGQPQRAVHGHAAGQESAV